MSNSNKKSAFKINNPSSGCCPGGSGCHPVKGLARREFLQRVVTSSLFLTAGSSLTYAAKAADLPTEPQIPAKPTFLPAPTPATPGVLLQTVNHGSGIPLGGIGTGSVEILPDGCLDDWLLFNMGRWSPDQDSADHGRSEPGMDGEAMPFYLRTKVQGNPPALRRLSVRHDQQDLYLQGWAKPVEGINYDGRYPLARLDYLDSSLPVAITGTFFSPMIPHDSRTSGTPGFHIVFTIKNTSKQPVEVALATKLKNPLARGADNTQRSAATRKLTNTIAQDGTTTYLTMRTDAKLRQKSTLGSIGLSVTGGSASWIAADFGSYLSNGQWATLPQSFLELLRAEGKLPNLGESGCPADLLPRTMDLDKIPDTELDNLLAQAARTALLKVWIDRSKTLKTGLATPEAKRHVLHQLRQRLDSFAGEDRRATEWGDAALCSSLTLKPGETKEIRFAFTWHFPHHLTVNREAELGQRVQICCRRLYHWNRLAFGDD